MPKSKAAEEMDELQSRLRPFFLDHGFKMRSRTCNRLTVDGLTEVINFQMGRFDPPGTSYIPWFRKNLYGKFTVNVGVYVPEVAGALFATAPASFIGEPDCCVRVRLGMLGPERADLWWKVRSNSRIVAMLQTRFERDAFPFLARFDSRDAILQELGAAEETWGKGGPPRVICAIILANRGQKDEAREYLLVQARKTARPDHTHYLKDLAERLKLQPLET